MDLGKILLKVYKKLSSLGFRLILYKEFDISENYNRSSFGKEDHESAAKIFKE